METAQGVGTGAGTGQGIGTNSGHRGITCVLQAQFSCLFEEMMTMTKVMQNYEKLYQICSKMVLLPDALSFVTMAPTRHVITGTLTCHSANSQL